MLLLVCGCSVVVPSLFQPHGQDTLSHTLLFTPSLLVTIGKMYEVQQTVVESKPKKFI
ncbi:hypothetical protein QTP86_017848 [Hemibagrus guttatus]|nr:hypothetical protein QTP86_017848 [Hemibagrus guttatus]